MKNARKNDARKTALYAGLVNKQWVRLLDMLGMNVRYTKCLGTKLWTDTGDCYTDFLSGYSVQNVGHNHPDVAKALVAELALQSPLIVQNLVPPHAGVLASKLCYLAGGRLTRANFTNTGSEGVETAIKFARVHTGRSGILYSQGAFHGISYGAMSLMKGSMWVEDFGPFLPGTQDTPFLDLGKLEEHLKTGKYAAFITEVIQSEAGLRMAPPEAFQRAQELCRKYGTLLVIDEVQTGVFRTGTFLASRQVGIEPDMAILAKALGGGAMPVGAVLMSEEINSSVYKSLDRALINASTFGENTLSLRAAVATLEIIERENLAQNAIELGNLLRERVNDLVPRYEMLKGVRGMGLMNGIEFCRPRSLKLKVLHDSFKMLHPALLGQMLVRRMFHEGKVLTQSCGNNYMVLKACPALTANEEDIEIFIAALEKTLAAFQSGRGFLEGLKIGKAALAR